MNLRTMDLVLERRNSAHWARKYISWRYYCRRENPNQLAVKGIRQDARQMKILDLNKLKQLAEQYSLNNNQIEILIHQVQIRTAHTHDVNSIHMTKIFRASSEKRRILGNDTLPYAFI